MQPAPALAGDGLQPAEAGQRRRAVPCPSSKRWSKGGLQDGYGLTEAGPNTFAARRRRRRKPGAVGFPLMHVDVRVVHPDRSECAGRAGRAAHSRPHVPPGWNNPAAMPKPSATAGCIPATWPPVTRRATPPSSGGSRTPIWLRRENVYPAEIEAMYRHLAIGRRDPTACCGRQVWWSGDAGEFVDGADRRGAVAFLRERWRASRCPSRWSSPTRCPRPARARLTKRRWPSSTVGS